MSKLAPPVSNALALWRTRTANGVADAPSGGEQLIVYVTYDGGDLQPLIDAGLAPGFDRRGRVSGRIAYRDLERLAAVPSGTFIEKEPAGRPLLARHVPGIRDPRKGAPNAAR